MLQEDFIFEICQTNPTKVAFVHSPDGFFFLFLAPPVGSLTRETANRTIFTVFILTFFPILENTHCKLAPPFNSIVHLSRKTTSLLSLHLRRCRTVVSINDFDVSLSSQGSSSVVQSVGLNPERIHCRQSTHLYKPIPTFQLTPPPREGLT